MSETLTHAERRAWWRLAHTQNVGPVTFSHLIARFGTATAALDEVPRLARAGGGHGVRMPSDDDAERELDALDRLGGRLIAFCEPDFPAALAAIDPPPPLLSMLGNAALLQQDMIAVVGARNASALGRKLAAMLAHDLGKAGLVVVSGLARGIDTASHEGAVATGTVGVVAGGVDVIYPPENAPLYERMRAEGCIVSEMPLRQAPQARHFPRRNRIISGLSRGVVVVEAAEGSGSLITANYALEQGREVFAVPGSPLDPRARGCNRLLRQGATLVETAQDVVSALRMPTAIALGEPRSGNVIPLRPAESSPDRARANVEEILGPAPTDIDEIVRLSRLDAASVASVLLELELAGRLTRHPGGRVSWAG